MNFQVKAVQRPPRTSVRSPLAENPSILNTSDLPPFPTLIMTTAPSNTNAVLKSKRRSWITGGFIFLGSYSLALRFHTSRQAEAAALELRRLEREAAEKRTAAEAETRRLRSLLSGEAKSALKGSAESDIKHAESCLAKLRTEIDGLHENATRRVSSIAGGLGSMAGITRSIFLLSRDQVTQSSEMQQALDHELTPLTHGLARMTASGQATLESIRRGLDAESNAIAARMLTRVEQVREEHEQALPDFAATLAPAIKAIRTGQIDLGLAAVTLPLEIGLVWSMVSWLKSRLEKWVSRAAAAASTNLVLVAADGPVPVGDAIALLLDLGFAIWAVWDIWHLTDWVPSNIANQLRSALSTHRDQVITAVQEKMNALLKQAQTAREAAMAPILALSR